MVRTMNFNLKIYKTKLHKICLLLFNIVKIRSQVLSKCKN